VCSSDLAEFQSERFYVKDLIKSALRPLLIPMELQSIALYTDIPEDAALQGDLNWLSEAAENIIKNCIENVGKNGEIRIICKDTALYTEIIISDNGKGFAKEDLPHLFDRFYRGKNQNTSGYGIGLALSKIIISRQGGIVTAKNHHSGAMFALRFAK
jgi:signal transduction histidine kinase